ncbi:ABC transporter ATP-binding protein [Lachnobacterium bovis]|uniref:Putative ABC transport system ATP-binding protein n=1 Tax=Lachnobacterium bovis DSM 14045 TaxID=1122142 RepID=A0A1H3KWN7_9FIRM|nr:ABC transporter ATP-binding protein [Lachnobacterium bovis]SDY56138.1 putative ABC transport system ATP-binding protein [Lachnobacterium bovis DSM 14045]
MIKLHNISKTFKTASSSQQILKNVDFSVMPEDFITIAGPSGCGKSTLLSIISLLLPPDDGKITYNGVNVDFSSQAQLEQMRVKYTGLIFQNPNLISSLNVLENVLLPANYKKLGKKATIEKAKKLLSDVGLSEKTNADVSKLSGGEMQRVSIARALINEPKVLFCDEPTGALDQETSQQILKLLLEIARKNKSAIVMVTHDNDIWEKGRRKVRLQGGKLIELG